MGWLAITSAPCGVCQLGSHGCNQLVAGLGLEHQKWSYISLASSGMGKWLEYFDLFHVHPFLQQSRLSFLKHDNWLSRKQDGCCHISQILSPELSQCLLLLPHSLGQNESQVQARTKMKGNRFLFLKGKGVWTCRDKRNCWWPSLKAIDHNSYLYKNIFLSSVQFADSTLLIWLLPQNFFSTSS